jgi:GH25 family lysozyme M1 (1,4-beta-N-acetylmuramidase)
VTPEGPGQTPENPAFVDISHWQPAFTADTLRSWPVGRIVVKLGGANNGIYESETHRAQVAAGHDAGLPADRYWYNGRDVSIADQVVAIRSFLALTPLRPDERFAWDVEDEKDGDTITTRRWTPGEVAQAAQLLADVVPLERQIVYASDSVTRSDDWSPVVALGLKPWPANYGANNGQRSSVPLVGHWPTAELWQYTSKGRMPGYDGDLDLNVRTPLWTVHALQQSLNELLGEHLVVDGDKGDDTTRVVEIYQGKFGLEVDGDPGTLTLTDLTNRLGGIPIYKAA